MSLAIKVHIPNNSLVTFLVSFFFHLAVLFSVIILLNLQDDRAKMNPGFVQVTTDDYNHNNSVPDNHQVQPKAVKEIDKTADETSAANKVNNAHGDMQPAGAFYSLSDSSADTSSLEQVYNEPTLNVTLKYPAGWSYIDQDVNKKLDGVTFWSNIGNFSPPPYINLEVRDKNLFDASRYKYNTWTWGFTIYYNDPEEMEGQVTQIFYIRTNVGEDFSFKLIMKGNEEFKAFQPVFFGMIKSFKFGKSLF